MSYKKRFNVERECKADLEDCHFIENVLVAHHIQRYLSTLKLEQLSDPLHIISDQNKLQIKFYKEYTDEHIKILVKYDITDMLSALDILEQSVLYN